MPLFWSEISSSLLTFRFHCLTRIFILHSPKNLTIAWVLIYDALDPGISLCKTHDFVYRNKNLYVTEEYENAQQLHLAKIHLEHVDNIHLL